MCPICLIVLVLFLAVIPAAAAQMQTLVTPQGSQPHQAAAQAQTDMDDMAGMQMPGMMQMAGGPAAGLHGEMSSGTSAQPRGWAMPMVMTQAGNWQLSWMAQAFVVDVQQSHENTPPGVLRRGGDKVYSVNWGMLSAEHPLGGGSVMLRTMMSLEPATVANRRFPELFQIGETAYGQPIVDGQHPHNLFMEIGTQYAHAAGKAVVNFYYAPVGDPALGPTAFPHRASAAELPQATLAHHCEDSTHIADDVATAEVTWHSVHAEASGFYGREPGENRWTVGFGPMDSWATRVTWLPAQDWQAQLSTGRLHHPEALSTGDEERTTASVEFAAGARAASVIWGRDYKTTGHYAVNAVTAEAVWPVSRRDYVTGRFEWSQRDELFADQPALEATLPRWFDVSAYTAGYTREVGSWRDAGLGLGVNATVYAVADGQDAAAARAAVSGIYGGRPWGVNLYLRLRLRAAPDAMH
jgi:hypothetical protein